MEALAGDITHNALVNTAVSEVTLTWSANLLSNLKTKCL